MVRFHGLLLDVADDGVGEQRQRDHDDAGDVEDGRNGAVGQREPHEADRHHGGRAEIPGAVLLPLDHDAAHCHPQRKFCR